MSSIDEIIEINISQQTQSVPVPSFSIPLIIGPTPTGWTDYVHSYTQPSSMLTDGFTTSSPEYIYALEMFEQAVSPTLFYVGKRTTAVEQQNTFQVNTLNTAHQYKFTMNGVVISYTAGGGDTQQSILTALNNAITAAFAIPPTMGAVVGSGPSATLTLTSVNPGAGISYSAVDSFLTFAQTVANNGITNDLANIISENNTWYGIVLCSNTDYDIEQLAAAVEPLKKIYIATTADAAVPTSSTTDIATVMKGKGYKRTALIYTAISATDGIDAAWVGGQLPLTPGSNNWAFVNLVGIDPDTFTDNQQTILIGVPVDGIAGKNVNIYQTVGGVNLTEMGTMIGGQYIDITIGIDWLTATIQTNILQALVSVPKIPYTDNGTAVLISAVKAAILQGIANGLIDGNTPYTVTAPSVLSVPASQRANRIAPTISFTCRLAGAFNAVIVSGTVTV
jgi:Protein of unknown function (DUF3383)